MKIKFRVGQIVALAVVVALLLGILPPGISIMASVPAGYTGILTTYGRVEDTALESGLHFKLPWQRIICLDNHIKVMRIAAGTSNATTADTAETKDQQLVPVFEFEIQYQLNPDMSYVVYSNYGENYADILITSNALQIIKEIFATYNANEIVGAKSAIPGQIKDKLVAITEPLGINIVRINMVTYDFSAEYTAILEQRALLTAQLENNELNQKNQTIEAQTQYDVAVKTAQKEAETQRIANEGANAIALAQANTQAEVDKIAADNKAYVTRTNAEANKDARLAAAQAQEAEVAALSAKLDKNVLLHEFIAKWDGKLIPNFGSTGIGFANYTDIISSYLDAPDDAQ